MWLAILDHIGARPEYLVEKGPLAFEQISDARVGHFTPSKSLREAEVGDSHHINLAPVCNGRWIFPEFE